MTRRLCAVAVAVLVGTLAAADDKKGTAVEVGKLKGTAPAEWTSEKPSNEMRLAQFKVAKEEGDPEDAAVVIFSLPGGGGVDANLKRQEAKFKVPDGAKDAVKTDDTKVGEHKAKYQDIKGTLLFKAAPFDPNAKVTEKEKFRQLYVIFEDEDKKTVSIWLLGPEKTVEKHKKAFDEFIKSFKK